MTEDKQDKSTKDKNDANQKDLPKSSEQQATPPSAGKEPLSKSLSATAAAKIAASAKRELAQDKSQITDKQRSKKAGQPADNKGSKQTSEPPTRNNQAAGASVKNKGSKTGALALVIALLAGAGVAGLYWWQQQQDAQQRTDITATTQAQLAEVTQSLQQQLKATTSALEQQLASTVNKFEQQSQDRVAVLEAQLQQLMQAQPQNWQLTEAEYLTRMAGRVLWLENDTQTAISLMQDADARIKDLKDPRFYQVRELIHQDIETLKALPVLDIDNIVLSLMALSKQVKDLPRPEVLKPEVIERIDSTALSDDVNDWQQNLAKTWQRFKQEFIIPRRLNGQVEPLMSADMQNNLYQNMDLKFQLAIWAASKGESQTYVQTMTDISAWIGEYFDRTQAVTQQFNARIVELKGKAIELEYPSELKSQQAIKDLLEQTGKPTQQAPTNDEPASADDNELQNLEQNLEQKQEQTPSQAQQANAEGNA